jgi:hypothetical protein
MASAILSVLRPPIYARSIDGPLWWSSVAILALPRTTPDERRDAAEGFACARRLCHTAQRSERPKTARSSKRFSLPHRHGHPKKRIRGDVTALAIHR